MTGILSDECVANVNEGVSPFAHATPASTKGAMSIGNSGLRSNPSCSLPRNGIRSSMLATAILDPTSRSNSGQEFELVGLIEHSEASNDVAEYPRTRDGSPRKTGDNRLLSASAPYLP